METRTYKLFRGTTGQAEVVMAIEVDELKESQPGDFFLPGFSVSKEIGEIEISGDNLSDVDAYFPILTRP